MVGLFSLIEVNGAYNSSFLASQEFLVCISTNLHKVDRVLERT